ncbi:MAG: hypothetical protein ACXW1Q_08995 [Halobacteriota archaeon]
MTLKYLIDYFPDHSGFVDFVLQENDKLYMQKVDINGAVLGFEEVDLEETIRLTNLPGAREATIGQQAWCGFRNKRGYVIIRQWQDMRAYLKETFVHYSDMLFLSYDIAEFLGDDKTRAACAEPIIEHQHLFRVFSGLKREYPKGK